MNIQTDVNVTPEMLTKCSWTNLKEIALFGTEEQKDTLLAWAWSAIRASSNEELIILTGRDHLLDE